MIGVSAALAGGLALPAPAKAAPPRSVAANLDADPELERVDIVRTRCRLFRGQRGTTRCEHLAILDGGRSTTVSPVVETFLNLEVADYNRDGTPEVFSTGHVGNGGQAPITVGLVGWTGTAPRPLFFFDTRRSDLGRSVAGARAIFEGQARSADPPAPLDLVLTEGVLSRRNAACCPSRQRTTVYRWNGSHYVPALRSLERAGKFLGLEEARREAESSAEELYLAGDATAFVLGDCSRRGGLVVDCTAVFRFSLPRSGDPGFCNSVVRVQRGTDPETLPGGPPCTDSPDFSAP